MTDEQLAAIEQRAAGLHGVAMNLPVGCHPFCSDAARLAYKLGHRDARHQAAELAAGAAADTLALLAEVRRQRNALRKLMAVIFRDGGQRAASYADDVAAAKAAEALVADEATIGNFLAAFREYP